MSWKIHIINLTSFFVAFSLRKYSKQFYERYRCFHKPESWLYHSFVLDKILINFLIYPPSISSGLERFMEWSCCDMWYTVWLVGPPTGLTSSLNLLSLFQSQGRLYCLTSGHTTTWGPDPLFELLNRPLVLNDKSRLGWSLNTRPNDSKALNSHAA